MFFVNRIGLEVQLAVSNMIERYLLCSLLVGPRAPSSARYTSYLVPSALLPPLDPGPSNKHMCIHQGHTYGLGIHPLYSRCMFLWAPPPPDNWTPGPFAMSLGCPPYTSLILRLIWPLTRHVPDLACRQHKCQIKSVIFFSFKNFRKVSTSFVYFYDVMWQRRKIHPFLIMESIFC